MKNIFRMKKGVALIIVMLIVLGATSIALISMHTMQNEARMSNAFQYNRQASRAAHELSIIIRHDAIQNAQKMCLETAVNNLTSAADNDDFKPYDSTLLQSQTLTKEKLLEFTGLSDNASSTNSSKMIGGDLTKSFKLVSTIGNFTISSEQVPGFSDPDAFSRFTMNASGYALVGKPATLHNKQYYLLSEVNSHVAGFKHEFGTLEVAPLSCR